MNHTKPNHNPILQVKNLTTSFQMEKGKTFITDNVSFDLHEGESLGIVGESGCGKSVTALSIMRLLPKPAGKIESDEILFQKTDILKLQSKNLCKIRGKKISMIFQEPMTALNPVHKIGKQIAEVFNLHNNNHISKVEIKQKTISLLKKVGIPDPEKRIEEYPYQISGGMRQRVVIAIALACEPDILIADEPTTALDVTIQAQLLELIKEIRQKTKMSIIFITHDLGVIAESCDNVLVMYAGQIVEKAAISDLFHKPIHPYTKGLLNSIPVLQNKRKTILNTIKGMVSEFNKMPQGCRFKNRCPSTLEICTKEEPPETKVNENHFVKCFLYHL